MEWLSPLVGLYAAAAAVPLLLLLYFLKLKRQEVMVSSTLLWRRAVQDLQVNAPFQRLRRNLLLLLQLLALATILAALAGPVLAWRRGPGQRFVLLIDRSASMSATDVKPNRLEAAKRQAKTFIESLRSGSVISLRDGSDHAMVIAFDQHAKVMCNLTSDKRQLLAALDAIEPSDGPSRLGEAVTVARAFAQSPGVEGNIRSAEEAARLVLFSDGRIQDLDTVVVASDELVFHCLGETQDNVGITAMNARRSYEQPELVEVFASLANYGAEPVTQDVQLALDGNVRAVRSVTIPAGQSQSPGGQLLTLDKGVKSQELTPPSSAFKPGLTAVNFSLTHGDAGVLEVRQLAADALPGDDAAWSILPPPKRLSVLLVTKGNPVLESALQACPLAGLDPCTPAGFDALDPAAFAVRRQYDVVVLDHHVPAHLPQGRYLVFGPPPNGIDVNSPRELDNQVIVDWRSQHPVLQYVNLANLFALKCRRLDLPRDAEVLAEFNESPALAFVRRQGTACLLVGFDVLQSNWPFEPGFILFCYNALSFLGAQIGSTGRHELAVGEPITLENVPAETVLTLTRPDATKVELKPDPGGTVRFPGTHRVGVYTLEAPGQPRCFYAVNLLDAEESRIAPQQEIKFSSVAVQAQDEMVQRANVPLWPLLVLAALVLVCLEWLAYNLKVRI
ncbi:MAG: VWA domain-containing protein [Planctomycetes bacterium]|nr:VWA domain-containing protein [Planctomycetota bacterium]